MNLSAPGVALTPTHKTINGNGVSWVVLILDKNTLGYGGRYVFYFWAKNKHGTAYSTRMVISNGAPLIGSFTTTNSSGN